MHQREYTPARARENTNDPAAPLGLNRAACEWARLTGTPRPHRSTLLRWATRGCRGVRLVAERHGNAWTITPAALAEFHRRLNEQSVAVVPAGPARAAQVAAAMAELDAITGEVS